MEFIQTPTTHEKAKYKQIYSGLETAIRAGRLSNNERLPSARSLASSLGVSRNTIARCMNDLISQGYITVKRGAGMYVNYVPPEDNLSSDDEAGSLAFRIASDYLSCYASQAIALDWENIERSEFLSKNLEFGTIEPSIARSFSRASQAACKALSETEFTRQNDIFGRSDLREALASRLYRKRGIRCSADQIAICSTHEQAVDLICRLLLDPGKIVLLENPTPVYFSQLKSYASALQLVSIDSDGVRVDKIPNVPRNSAVLFVTPAHQDPTGIALSEQRRIEVLQWAARRDALVIEDERFQFRYSSRPIPALKSIDQHDSVFFIGGFDHILGPLSKVSFVVAPKAFINPMRAVKKLLCGKVCEHEQLVLMQLLSEGVIDRTSSTVRRGLAEKRRQFVKELRQHFQDKIKIATPDSGFCLLVQFRLRLNDEQIVVSAMRAGLKLVPTKQFYVFDPVEREFLLNFDGIETERIPAAVTRFAELLAPSRQTALVQF